jgi:hypothetical protein
MKIVISYLLGASAVLLSYLAGLSGKPTSPVLLLPAIVLILLCMLFAQDDGVNKSAKGDQP